MNESMLSLITQSNHVTTSTRGKALGLLHTGTISNRRRDKFEEAHQEEPSLLNLGTQATSVSGSAIKRPLPTKGEKDRRR
jgi:hypothetical protein